MMKFLEDLKNELIKMKLNKQEIEEIMADHQEMIEQATKEGLTEDEITAKFGDPAKLARELKLDNPTTSYYEGVNQMKEGYELFKTFQVVEALKEVDIKVVFEDVDYLEHNLETIEVYYKNVKNHEDYTCEYNGGVFVLKTEKRKMMSGLFKSPDITFIVKVPSGMLDKFKFNSVSGDVEATNINAAELNFNSTSGDLEVSALVVENGLIKTVSGDAEIATLQAKTMKLQSVSGDFEVFNGSVEGEFDINTVSGDFEVKNFEAGETTFTTVSGDLEGRNFYPTKLNLRSVSGDIEIQNDDKSKTIEIGRKKTVSGDISIN